MDDMTHTPPTNDPVLLRMQTLGLREEDFQETFVRSGGHGGQNVNKTSTCVMLRHVPTGLSVKCQTSRHQGRNRILARQMLMDKIEEVRQKRAMSARSAAEKIRRQKRKRSRSAKNKMLADKAHHASIKSARRKVTDD